jgi:hypothetical protein
LQAHRVDAESSARRPPEAFADENNPLQSTHIARRVAPNSRQHQNAPQSAPIVLKYMRSLSRITGTITDPAVLAQYDAESPPAGMGPAVNQYLDAHGYDAAAKLEISYAYRTFNDVDAFCDHLCQRGMSQAEASWLFGYITFTDG